MERVEITYFFEDFCKKNVATFKHGLAAQNEVREQCRFLNNIAMSFPQTTTALTNYTQILAQDIEWTRPLNHQFAINGLAQYFGEPESYEIFNIIKHVITTEQFISESQRDRLNGFTQGTQATKYIYAYLINKQLSSIYASWKINPKYRKDALIIHTKFSEIYSSNNIDPSYPDIQKIANDEGLLEPNQSWRTLLQSAVPVDDFIAFIKIWRFLKDYSVMVFEYNTVLPNEPEPVPVSVAPEKKKKKPVPAALKRKVWAKWLSEEIGKAKCMCCNLTDITQLNFHCGHIISEAEGGELKVDNLKPICQSCNSSMGTMNMDEFMKKYGF
jgi:hypothetical protein